MNYSIWFISRSGHSFIKNNLMSWTSARPKISAENWPRQKILQNIKDEQLFTIIRDPYNNVASLIGHLLKNENYPLTAMDKFIQRLLNVWCEIVETTFEENIAIPILYSDFKETGYRRRICDFIGGDYNEDFLNVVPPNGGYSSFDGKSLDGQGQLMKTFDRWKKVIDSEHKERYLSYFANNKKVLELYSKYLENYKTNEANEYVKKNI